MPSGANDVDLRRAVRWWLPLVAGALAVSFLGWGAGAALSGNVGRPISEVGAFPTPTPVPFAAPGDATLVVALGDSMTRGAGDTASRGGYPGRVAEQLRRAGRPAVVANLALDGATTVDLKRRLDSAEARERVAAAALIVFSISGNDLTRSLAGADRAADPSARLASDADGVRTAVADILARLRALNPKAPIRLVGLYPLPAEGVFRDLGRRQLHRWNTALAEAALTQEGVLVVPVADVFEERPDRLAADRFHPGPSGYDEIASRLVAGLPESLAGATRVAGR